MVMVNFEAKVYRKAADGLCGVKVLVYDDLGEYIDSIQITNKLEFDELVARLDNLDETFVSFDDESSLSGLTIDEILTNSSESITINATTLSGLNADDFSKPGHNHNDLYFTETEVTNLLAGKANSSHDHDNRYYTETEVNTILAGIVNTQIECSTYDVAIDDTINAVVNLRDYKGDALSNKNVTLTVDKGYFVNPSDANDTSRKSISANTDSQGKVTVGYVASEWGLCTFTANKQSNQINVRGWKVIHSSNFGKIATNGEMVHLWLATKPLNNETIKSNDWTFMGHYAINERYAPVGTIYYIDTDQVTLRLVKQDTADPNGRWNAGDWVLFAVRYAGDKVYTDGYQFRFHTTYPVY